MVILVRATSLETLMFLFMYIYIDRVWRKSDSGFDLVGAEERRVGKGCIEN